MYCTVYNSSHESSQNLLLGYWVAFEVYLPDSSQESSLNLFFGCWAAYEVYLPDSSQESSLYPLPWLLGSLPGVFPLQLPRELPVSITLAVKQPLRCISLTGPKRASCIHYFGQPLRCISLAAPKRAPCIHYLGCWATYEVYLPDSLHKSSLKPLPLVQGSLWGVSPWQLPWEPPVDFNLSCPWKSHIKVARYFVKKNC